MRPFPVAFRFAALAAALICAAVSSAHEFGIVQVRAELRPGRGVYEIDVQMDVDALALGVPPAMDSAELAARLKAMPAAQFEEAVEWARRSAQRRVRIRFEGEKQMPAVEFPEHGAPAAEGAEPTVLGTIVRFTGPIPPGAQAFTFGVSRALGPARLTIVNRATGETRAHPLGVGENSPPYRLSGAEPQSGAGSDFFDVAGVYLALGFEHILPEGVDHILFVLGLFLLSTKFRPLLWQITAFTVAHSVTLALAVFGVFELPARLVESLIALSIAYVAVENILTPNLKPWRPFVVFGFGLLHGLGFAGVLRELGLPREEFIPALIAFNVGVEIGQLTVVLMAFLAVRWFLDKRWYRHAIVIPASGVIAAIGAWWSVERAFWGV